jgi:hypothetical protein
MSSDLSYRGPIILGLSIVALWAVAGGLVHFLVKDPGTFGDMFGAVNALFSGLAFGGVIYAVLLQRQELKLQRDELQLTRHELAGQKEQMQAQNETLKKQNFENTFFQLLRLHNDIVNAIDLRNESTGAVTSAGRDCFRIFYERFRKRWDKGIATDAGNNDLDRINKTYLAFYEGLEAELGHYFRSLYNIMKFVDGSVLPNKRLYTNLVRAQLSAYELALLFYNCLSDLGSEKFKPLVERYALLKMVPSKMLPTPRLHMALYNNGAYAGE